MATIEVEKVKLQIQTNFQEIFTESEIDHEQLSKWKKLDIIRELFPKMYSSNLADNSEDIVNRNWDQVIAKVYPGSIISHRTALEGKRPEQQDIYLTAAFTKHLELPGLTLHFKQGHPPVKDDYMYCENVFVSQVARAYLENMQIHQGPDQNRCMPVEDVDQRLDTTIRMYGEQELQNIRVRAEELAHKLGMNKEFDKLNVFFTQLLGPKKSDTLRYPDFNKNSTRRFKRKLGR